MQEAIHRQSTQKVERNKSGEVQEEGKELAHGTANHVRATKQEFTAKGCHNVSHHCGGADESICDGQVEKEDVAGLLQELMLDEVGDDDEHVPSQAHQQEYYKNDTHNDGSGLVVVLHLPHSLIGQSRAAQLTVSAREDGGIRAIVHA